MTGEMCFACGDCSRSEEVNSAGKFVSSVGLLGLQQEQVIDAAMGVVGETEELAADDDRRQATEEVLDITATVGALVKSVDMEAVSAVNSVLEGDCSEVDCETTVSGCQKLDKLTPLLASVLQNLPKQ